MSKNLALRKRIKEIFDIGHSEDPPRPKTKSSRIRSPCTPSYSPPYSTRAEKNLKINDLRGLIKEDLKKGPEVHSTYLSRDISHLQDKRLNSITSLSILPTDLETLKKLKECAGSTDHATGKCIRGNCINETYLLKNRSLESEQSESIEKLVTGSPTGRQEAKELCNWFHSMLAYHRNASIDSIMLIYDHCVNEITRQVAVSCAERGELLGTLFKHQSELHKKKVGEIEKDFESQILALNNKIKLAEQNRSAKEKEATEKLEEKINKLNQVFLEKEKIEKELSEANFKLNDLNRKYLEEEQVWQKKNLYLMLKLKEFYRPVKVGTHKTATVNWVERKDDNKTELKELEDLYLSELENKDIMSLDEHTLDSEKYLYSYDRHLNRKFRSILKWNFSTSKTENFSYLPRQKILEICREEEIEISNKKAKKNNPRRIIRRKTKRKTTKTPYLIHIQSLESSPKPQMVLQKFSADNLASPLLSPDALTVNSYENHSENKDSETNDLAEQELEKNLALEAESLEDEESHSENPQKLEETRKNDENLLNRAKSLRTVFQKKVKEVTKFNEFQFNHSTGVKKQHPAYNFLTKVLVSDECFSKCSISRKMVNKLITSNTQNALLKHKTGEKIESFFEQVYDDFYQKYGLKGMSEKRFTEFLSSLFGYIEYKRVSVFVRLLGIAGRAGLKNYSKRVLWYYLDCLDYMMSSKIGVVVAFDEIADKQMFPSIRAIMCVRDKTEWFAESEEVNYLVNKVLSESEEDLKGINPHGLIELETLLSIIVDLYEQYVREIEKGVYMLAEAFGLEEVSGYYAVLWCRAVHQDRFENQKDALNLDQDFDLNNLYSLFEVSSKCIQNRMLKAADVERFSEFNNETNQELQGLFEDAKTKYFAVKEDIESASENQQLMSEVFQFFELVSNCFDMDNAPNLNSLVLQILELEFSRILKSLSF